MDRISRDLSSTLAPFFTSGSDLLLRRVVVLQPWSWMPFQNWLSKSADEAPEASLSMEDKVNMEMVSKAERSDMDQRESTME